MDAILICVDLLNIRSYSLCQSVTLPTTNILSHLFILHVRSMCVVNPCALMKNDTNVIIVSKLIMNTDDSLREDEINIFLLTSVSSRLAAVQH